MQQSHASYLSSVKPPRSVRRAKRKAKAALDDDVIELSDNEPIIPPGTRIPRSVRRKAKRNRTVLLNLDVPHPFLSFNSPLRIHIPHTKLLTHLRVRHSSFFLPIHARSACLGRIGRARDRVCLVLRVGMDLGMRMR